MRKLLNNPWFVLALAFGAVLAIGWGYIFPAPQHPARASQGEFSGGEGASGLESSGQPLSPVAALRAVNLKGDIRDPFALPPKPAEADAAPNAPAVIIEPLHLSASWVQGSTVLLLLNGRICQPGETFEHFTVESAALDGAWILHSGGRSFLGIGQRLALKVSAPVKTPPSP